MDNALERSFASYGIKDENKTAVSRFYSHLAECVCATASWAEYVGDECCESPIEKQLLVAIALSLQNRVYLGSPGGGPSAFLFNEDATFTASPGESTSLFTQFKINNYRVDFLIVRKTYSHSSRRVIESPRLVIECDGHDFHERTKEQAQRDKARDRILLAEGYHVMRFTGSEIFRDSFKCALEIDEFLDDKLRKIDRELFDVTSTAKNP